MLVLHLKPGLHWRLVAFDDRSSYSVADPPLPLVVMRDENDGTLFRPAKLRERAILGWATPPQPSEQPG